MNSQISLGGNSFAIDPDAAIDLSIPLNFNGPQPNAFGVETASSEPCRAGDLVGDTRQGGSCNFEQYTFIPHCNGTHTECIGHITHERFSIGDCLREAFIPATLISVEPVRAPESADTYTVEADSIDLIITRKALERAFKLDRDAESGCDALIVRTLPNDEAKKARSYGEDNIPPYFSTEAMEYVVDLGVRHLLVDLPSIDRLFDEGKLSNHRIFWNVGQGSFETNSESRIHNTVTEMIYVPSDVVDGGYLLNLQIAPFQADAAPSRPVIFPINQP